MFLEKHKRKSYYYREGDLITKGRRILSKYKREIEKEREAIRGWCLSLPPPPPPCLM